MLNAGELMVNAKVAVSLTVPEMPVTVTQAPWGALTDALAVSVSTLLPVVGSVTQDEVTPLGKADVTARLTLPVNPA